jgi:phosphatidylglycerophosphate synthase
MLSKSPGAGGKPTVALVVGPAGPALWRVDPVKRLRRELARRGIGDIRQSADGLPTGASVLILRADVVYDPMLLRALADTPSLALVMPDGDEVVGLHSDAATATSLADEMAAGRLTADAAARFGLRPRSPEDATGSYRDALRKREKPYLLRVTPQARRIEERRLFGASYKGVTDIVTKYVWPEPAFWATQGCVRLGLSPNMVTLASLLLVAAAFYLFAEGEFGLGLIAAWLMTFLDTVDGKLARVTVTYTRFGGAFDHAIDLIHPPFWYWAWMMGLQATGQAPPDAAFVLAVIVGGYVLQRVEEGAFIARHRIEMHVWRRFDSLFRLVTARRNPNLIILTASLLVGRPDLGILAVAWWTAICFGVHLLCLIQAEAARRGAPLASWLDR